VLPSIQRERTQRRSAAMLLQDERGVADADRVAMRKSSGTFYNLAVKASAVATI